MINIIIKFLKKIFGDDGIMIIKKDKYDKIKTKLLSLEKEMKSLLEDNNILKEELEETEVKLIEANKKIEELSNEGIVDVESLKNVYLSRLGNKTWVYNWDGKGDKPVEDAFRYKNSSTGPSKLKDMAVEIKKEYNFKRPNKVKIIESIKDYFTDKSNWTYVYDEKNRNHLGIKDYWQEIDVSIDSRRGDCEDLAILMHMLIRTLFDMFNYTDSKWRLLLTAGRMVGYGGHAYNVWLHDDGYYYVIESTYDLEGSFKRTWLKTPVAYNNLYRDFWGFANPRYSRRNASFSKNLEALKK